MNPVQLDIASRSPEETHRLGVALGSRLEAGTVIALTGELGSGKTAMVQGIARGLDVPSDYYITSPTFTLINAYPGRHTLYHADLYRLEDLDAIEETGLYDLLWGKGVVAIEWAERLEGSSLKEHIRIHLSILDDSSRQLRLSAHGKVPRRIIADMDLV